MKGVVATIYIWWCWQSGFGTSGAGIEGIGGSAPLSDVF
jgi:hypothetical protein